VLRATIPALAASLLVAAGLMGGCAADPSNTQIGDTAGDGGDNSSNTDSGSSNHNDSGSYGNDSGSHNGDGGNGQCVSHCTSDTDCQNSCAPLPNGVSCCDIPSGSCYGAQGSACPTPQQGGDGGNPPGY
jgi:hypothetical protein